MKKKIAKNKTTFLDNRLYRIEIVKILFFIILYHVPFSSKAQEKESYGLDKKDIGIQQWIDQTDIIFSIDSLKKSSPNAFSISEYISRAIKNLRITSIDSLKGWYVFPLNKIIRYAGRISNNFYFTRETAVEIGDLMIESLILEGGYVYGIDLASQLFSKLNFYTSKKYEQRIFFEAPFNGHSFQIIFLWVDNGLVVTSPRPLTNGPPKEKPTRIKYRQRNSPLNFMSNSVRDYLEVPDALLTLSLSQYEENANNFLSTYFKGQYPNNSELSNKTPPTISLSKVKGYITKSPSYWEKVDIRIDNIQRDRNKLMVQCTIDGIYVDVTSPDISLSAFDKPSDLEKNYLREIRAKAFLIISEFKTYLLKK